MAERPFQPVPNTPLVADPTGDAIWKRWLQGLQQFLGNAVRGPGSSTDNAVARWDGTTGTFLNNSGVIIDDSNNVSGIVNLTTTGNTILGDASADTFTLNAGTITFGANWTATRAAGTLAAGTVQILQQNTTFTGNASGTNIVRGLVYTADAQGANNFSNLVTFRANTVFSGTGNVTSVASGINSVVTNSNTGSITEARGHQAVFELTSSGNITSANYYYAISPTTSSTGTITNLTALFIPDYASTKVANAYGVVVSDQTNFTATASGFLSQISAGAGKKNINVTGTADNVIAGNTRLGGTTAPTVALDVTGAALISSTLGVTGAASNAIGNTASASTNLNLAAGTTAASSIRLPHGAAPTAPVDGDMWTTTAGLFVRINGVTVGPLS